MGVSYTVFVLPKATAMDFNPDGRILSELVELLCRLKWGRDLEGSRVNVGDDAGGIVAVPIHEQAKADAFDRLIAQRRGFSFRLPEVADDVFWPDGQRREDGLSRKYDFSDDPAGMFRPQYCDGATVIWSPFLVSVPRDSYNGTPVPCGGCRADVLEDIDARTPEARGLHFAGIAQEVPERCRSCGILLEPRGLIAEMRSGITGRTGTGDSALRAIRHCAGPEPPRRTLPSTRMPSTLSSSESSRAARACHSVMPAGGAERADLHCEESDAWEYTAVACKLCEAEGAYRGPAGSALVFMTFRDVMLTKGVSSPPV